MFSKTLLRNQTKYRVFGKNVVECQSRLFAAAPPQDMVESHQQAQEDTYQGIDYESLPQTRS